MAHSYHNVQLYAIIALFSVVIIGHVSSSSEHSCLCNCDHSLNTTTRSYLCNQSNSTKRGQFYDYRCCFSKHSGDSHLRARRSFTTSYARQFYAMILKKLYLEDKKADNINFHKFTAYMSKSIHEGTISKLSGCKITLKPKVCYKNLFNRYYRQHDGTCNNFHNAVWGAASIVFRRLLPPRYDNYLNRPVGWSSLNYLPSARELSNKIVSAKKIQLSKVYTDVVMHWGQFVDHDLTLVESVDKKISNECKDHCKKTNHCFPIPVTKNDTRFSCNTCLHLTRAAAACGTGLTSVFYGYVSPRNQINSITAYLDSSNVYGSSFKEALVLRKYGSKGLLKTGIRVKKGKFLLPYARKGQTECPPEDAKKTCFLAGDKRANEQLGLTTLHTIWVREHNRIAKILAQLNPWWPSNKIYNEARKIVIATNQHITYKHFLPKLLGDKYHYLIHYYSGYKKHVDPSIIASFAGAAYRIGHTLIKPILHRLDEDYLPIPYGNLRLKDAFFAPDKIVHEGGIDPILRGITGTLGKLKVFDRLLTKEVTDHLFEFDKKLAEDLASLNIQRGRDLGLPSYNSWRKYCHLREARTFNDLSGEIDAKLILKLSQLYESPDDIDLWVGGISERNLPNAVMGPTFACIVALQFTYLRDGDRFWYERYGVFNGKQLEQIKQTSLARVICDNSDNITSIQPDVFMNYNATGNSIVDCNSIPGIKLDYWKKY